MNDPLPILAVDLGKFNSALCSFPLTTKHADFRTVRTTSGELRRELFRQPMSRVDFEACSQAGRPSFAGLPKTGRTASRLHAGGNEGRYSCLCRFRFHRCFQRSSP